MAARVRLFSIVAVELELRKSDPPQLAVAVHGYAVSTGWTDPKLVPLERKLSADGILDLDFVATPPDLVNLPQLTPQTAELAWTDDVNRLVGVRVVSRTNEIVRLVPPYHGATTTEPVGEESTQIVGEAPHPHYAVSEEALRRFTTLALGEETLPSLVTGRVGEQQVIETTTLLGEEGALPPSGGYPPPTAMVGEQGPGPAARATALPQAAAPMTAPPIEKTTQVAGAGAVPPHMTTLALGEEQGGGGTMFTTLAYGEEVSTTAPGFEEMMPAPAISSASGPQGAMTTLALGEEEPPRYPTTLAVGEEGGQPTTLVVGEEGTGGPTTLAVGEEVWLDPHNQNPFGRR